MNEQRTLLKRARKGFWRHFKYGTALANKEIVKKSITYREITLGIGILVAVVIVLTLWVRKPAGIVSGYDGKPQVEIRMSAKNFFKTAVTIFKF